MPYFSVGKNTPGYVADNWPYLTDSESSAKMALIEDMAGMVEMFSDALNDAEHITAAEGLALGRAINEYQETMDYLANIEVSEGYSTILPGDPLSRHDLGLAFWIDPIDADYAKAKLAEGGE